MLDYIYARSLSFFSKKSVDVPEYTAVLVVTLLSCFILLDLYTLFQLYFETTQSITISKFWGLIPFFFFLFFYKYRYDKKVKIADLMERLNQESTVVKTVKGLLILIFLIGSILFFILFGLTQKGIKPL
jgi:hypothetical protein